MVYTVWNPLSQKLNSNRVKVMLSGCESYVIAA